MTTTMLRDELNFLYTRSTWRSRTTGWACTRCAGLFEHSFHLVIQSYWLGLYKITASPSSASYWYATGWYSGSTSRYRAWARGYPRHKYDTCVLYTSDGWKDSPCSIPCYFSCKKPAGTAVHGWRGGEGGVGEPNPNPNPNPNPAGTQLERPGGGATPP